MPQVGTLADPTQISRSRPGGISLRTASPLPAAGLGAEALMQAGRLGPDAVLLAATLPDIHAVDVVKALHEALQARVLLGAGPADAQTALAALPRVPLRSSPGRTGPRS
jgi:CheY-like chemotaxis protein